MREESMKSVTLFIAVSLDGYIADMKGNVDWLHGEDPSADDMCSYQEFIRGIDTVILGRNTYHQIVTELSPKEWPYRNLKSYVLTHQTLTSDETIEFVHEDVCKLLEKLKQEDGKGIWVCGGAKIIRPLVSSNLIDRYHLSVIPVILGNGVRLFHESETKIKLCLKKVQSYNGITDLVYERRRD